MSDNKNNPQNDTKSDLETRLADAKATAESLLNKRKAVVVSEENVVDVATTRSGVDIVLWLIAISALISSTLISTYLPRYWAPATESITQLLITAGLVLLAVICLAFTHQGRAFKVLLKDAGIELRRVTWPTKNETFKYTWQVIVVMIIVGFIVWLLDNLFNYLLGFILH
ncbi:MULTISPECIES: preprotein translocase subunit SecE [Moraxella]|jgi:preprotein translocase, secE subunit|uniref:Protein translocase subunit SecE n=1 Tax=Moraxella lacunata TaxID=477 RepID=A0A1B8Q469_MORLA|nr:MULTISPECIES: preprotein translocase subunit SecE [Moraxella]MBE9579342.1 preprotein translocase subunit SecE [Moraxella sp. K1664]MBE9588707.1 preprotein translocase subunit SecE [Moraxella sp. K1630]MBE9590740.1 preprotein translocase subunit SecE [Moraxella sp. K127]MBE9596923.1 preprotein translocase subunit SecE [Moraxella sp. K2450]MDH9219493.1 preprotein translocase subunit SecE [Moraxella lacunata]